MVRECCASYLFRYSFKYEDLILCEALGGEQRWQTDEQKAETILQHTSELFAGTRRGGWEVLDALSDILGIRIVVFTSQQDALTVFGEPVGVSSREITIHFDGVNRFSSIMGITDGELQISDLQGCISGVSDCELVASCPAKVTEITSAAQLLQAARCDAATLVASPLETGPISAAGIEDHDQEPHPRNNSVQDLGICQQESPENRSTVEREPRSERPIRRNHALGVSLTGTRTEQGDTTASVYYHIVTSYGDNLKMLPVPGDGNCLFASIVHQLENLDSKSPSHKPAVIELRRKSVDYLERHWMEYELQILAEAVKRRMIWPNEQQKVEIIRKHINNLREDGFWAGSEVISAIADMRKTPIKVFTRRGVPMVFGEHYPGRVARIFFSGDHYDSVVDLTNARHEERAVPLVGDDGLRYGLQQIRD